MKDPSRTAPRNYFGIAPPGQVDRSVPPVYHDCLSPDCATGALELEIEALTPVHVGCGSFGLDGERICKEPTRRAGDLVIPGASIKGVCRQAYEALTASGSPFDSREWHRAARPGDNAPPVSAAAALFGTLGLQGRITFDDALPVHAGEPTALQPVSIQLSVAYLPRKPVGRRFYGPLPSGSAQAPSVPASAIPAHTVLRTRLRFRNLTRQELGGILISLGVGRFTPRLGGGRYDDFGWVRFRPTAYRLRPSGLTGGGACEREEGAVAAFVEDCQARVRLDGSGKSALETLTRKLQFPAALSRQGDPP